MSLFLDLLTVHVRTQTSGIHWSLGHLMPGPEPSHLASMNAFHLDEHVAVERSAIPTSRRIPYWGT